MNIAGVEGEFFIDFSRLVVRGERRQLRSQLDQVRQVVIDSTARPGLAKEAGYRPEEEFLIEMVNNSLVETPGNLKDERRNRNGKIQLVNPRALFFHGRYDHGIKIVLSPSIVVNGWNKTYFDTFLYNKALGVVELEVYPDISAGRIAIEHSELFGVGSDRFQTTVVQGILIDESEFREVDPDLLVGLTHGPRKNRLVPYIDDRLMKADQDGSYPTGYRVTNRSDGCRAGSTVDMVLKYHFIKPEVCERWLALQALTVEGSSWRPFFRMAHVDPAEIRANVCYN